jgi:hypothetical protein
VAVNVILEAARTPAKERRQLLGALEDVVTNRPNKACLSGVFRSRFDEVPRGK